MGTFLGDTGDIGIITRNYDHPRNDVPDFCRVPPGTGRAVFPDLFCRECINRSFS